MKLSREYLWIFLSNGVHSWDEHERPTKFLRISHQETQWNLGWKGQREWSKRPHNSQNSIDKKQADTTSLRDFPGSAQDICLPIQGTWVQCLVWEEFTHCGATKAMCHNYWTLVLQLLKPVYLEAVLHRDTTATRSPCSPMKSSLCSLQLEKAYTQQPNIINE